MATTGRVYPPSRAIIHAGRPAPLGSRETPSENEFYRERGLKFFRDSPSFSFELAKFYISAAISPTRARGGRKSVRFCDCRASGIRRATSEGLPVCGPIASRYFNCCKLRNSQRTLLSYTFEGVGKLRRLRGKLRGFHLGQYVRSFDKIANLKKKLLISSV